MQEMINKKKVIFKGKTRTEKFKGSLDKTPFLVYHGEYKSATSTYLSLPWYLVGSGISRRGEPSEARISSKIPRAEKRKWIKHLNSYIS